MEKPGLGFPLGVVSLDGKSLWTTHQGEVEGLEVVANDAEGRERWRLGALRAVLTSVLAYRYFVTSLDTTVFNFHQLWPSTCWPASERVCLGKGATAWSGHVRANCFATASCMDEGSRRASQRHEGSPALPPLLAATVLEVRGAPAERRSLAAPRLTLTRTPHEIADTRERIRPDPEAPSSFESPKHEDDYFRRRVRQGH